MNKYAGIAVLAIGLILSLLLLGFGKFGNNQTLQNQNNSTMDGQQVQSGPSSWEEVESNAIQHLDDSSRMVYEALTKDNSIEAMGQKAAFWQSTKHFELFGHYTAQKSKLEKSEKSLTFANPLLLEILRQETNSGLKSLLADDILALSALGNDYFSTSDEWEYYEALALIEGKNETMQGVQKLLAITRKDPRNLEANIELAQLALKSQQYDKAIDRLEKLISYYPKNTEAMFFLAEAYKGKGDRNQAIKWFEECKKIVNNPDFTKEIDDYIKTF